jgi:hypothetical protein
MECCVISEKRGLKRCGVCLKWLCVRKLGSPSIDHRMKIGVANSRSHSGKTLTEEHRRNISRGMLGRIQSEETRSKISESHRKPETIARRVAARRANGKPWRSEESILKQMATQSASGSLYRRSAGVHGGIRMRCLNSEGVFARELDRVGIEWLYEPRWFRTRHGMYLPDFFLPEFNIWIEVKGSWIKPRALAKIQAFREEYGKCLVIVHQSELPTIKYGGD